MNPLPRFILTCAVLTAAFPSCDKKRDAATETPLRTVTGLPAPPGDPSSHTVAVPAEMEKPVPPETAQADFAKLVAAQSKFRTERTRRAQIYYAKVMERLHADLIAEKPTISEETFLTYNDKVALTISGIDGEGQALAAEMQRHQQTWTAKKWSGYVLLDHLPLPVSAHPDMSKWPRTSAETATSTAARTDFLERRSSLHRTAMTAAETKLMAAWRQVEQSRASLPVPAPHGELARILTTTAQLRAEVEVANSAVVQAHTESEKLWKEWESKSWLGYVIEKTPPSDERIGLLPAK